MSQKIPSTPNVATAVSTRPSSEQRYDTLIGNLPGAVYRCLFDDAWTMLYMSQGVFDLTGYSPDDFTERRVRFAELIDPQDNVQNVERVARAMETGEPFHLEYRLRHADGKVRWVSDKGQVFTDDQGRPVHIDGAVFDITDRKATERRLKRTKAFLRGVIDSLSSEAAILDSTGNIVMVNDAWNRFAAANSGGDRDFVNENYMEVCREARGAYSQGAAEIADAIDDVLHGRRPVFVQDYPCHGRDEQRWFTCRVTGFEHGGQWWATVTHENITQRHLAEQALAQSEERFKVAIAGTSDGLWDWNLLTGEMWYAPRFKQLIGYSESEFSNRIESFWPLVHPADQPGVRAALTAHFEGGVPYNAEFRMRHRKGHYRWFHSRGESIRDEAGRPVRLAGSVQDITERINAVALERERNMLRDALLGMEQVLGVVGHELRTPVAAIRASSELLLTDELRDCVDQTAMIRAIHDESIRLAETISNLLEAARMSSGKARWTWVTVHLEEECERAVKLARPLLQNASIEFSHDVEPRAMTMQGDRDAISRLILNLVTNACKHTRRGAIRIIARQVIVAGERWVRLSVTDTGDGIAPDILPKLGIAFALNAGAIGADYIKGAGLGLAICNGIATAHGGRIDVQSGQAQGSTFTVMLRADLTYAVCTPTPNGAIENAA